MRRALTLLLIAAAVVVAAPSLASGGEGPELDVDLVSPIEPLTFEAKFEDGTCAEGPFDFEVTANGNAVTPVSATQSVSDPDRFVFVLANDTPPGSLTIDLSCDNGDGTTSAEDTQGWAAIAVTKVVTGSAPAGATFTVHVDCVRGETEGNSIGPADIAPDFDVDLQYTAAGGVHYVYTDHGVDCTITEPVNGGASSVSIQPERLLTVEPAPFSATVTNTFAAALQPNFTG